MTDIEGSTRLFRELGDTYVEVLATHQALLRAAFTTHGGVEVDIEADALFVVYADAADAVAACLDCQRAFAHHPWPPGGEVRVRVGLHTSEAAPVGHGYVDLAVHQVARTAPEPTGAKSSSPTRRRTPPTGASHPATASSPWVDLSCAASRSPSACSSSVVRTYKTTSPAACDRCRRSQPALP